MQVGLDRGGGPDAAACPCGAGAAGPSAWVEDERTAITGFDEIGGVAEPVVAERDRVPHRPSAPSASTGSPRRAAEMRLGAHARSTPQRTVTIIEGRQIPVMATNVAVPARTSASTRPIVVAPRA